MLLQQIMVDFHALIMMAEHSGSLLHRPVWVQYRDESLTPNFWMTLYRTPSFVSCAEPIRIRVFVNEPTLHTELLAFGLLTEPAEPWSSPSGRRFRPEVSVAVLFLPRTSVGTWNKHLFWQQNYWSRGLSWAHHRWQSPQQSALMKKWITHWNEWNLKEHLPRL